MNQKQHRTERLNKIRAVVELCGGVDMVAFALKIGKPAIFAWYRNGIPATHAPKLSDLTKGKFSVDEITREMGAKA